MNYFEKSYFRFMHEQADSLQVENVGDCLLLKSKPGNLAIMTVNDEISDSTVLHKSLKG